MRSEILPDSKLIAIVSDSAFVLGVLSSTTHCTWAVASGSTLEDRPTYVKTASFEAFPFPDQDTGLTPELRSRIADLVEQIDALRKRVLTPPLSLEAGQSGVGESPAAALPAGNNTGKKEKLTLTGLYNVLEALKEGRELTPKEKAIHTQGLVGVLKDLHDELDAAVLQAYGWTDLHVGAPDTPELLTRLVALNARRAAEEKTGTVRWLRPDFQNPSATAHSKLLSKDEQLALIPPGLEADLASSLSGKSHGAATDKLAATTAAPRAWPASLPEQVRAVAAVLASTPIAMPLDAIEAHFKSRGAWKKSLPRILETLEALGRARREGDAWRS